MKLLELNIAREVCLREMAFLDVNSEECRTIKNILSNINFKMLEIVLSINFDSKSEIDWQEIDRIDAKERLEKESIGYYDKK